MPPALTHGDTDAFEGLSVLDEISGQLGLVLWQSLRDAMLWGRAGKAERDALFTPGADQSRVADVLAANAPEDLEEPLKTMAAMLGAPSTMREENVALACRQVAQWAEAKGLLAAALSFAQAAAVVNPADPTMAYAVARLARRRREYPRSETWFRRTIALARQAGDWPTYALAFDGLGNLYVARGNFPVAKRFFERALKAAQRNSLHDIAGMALHDLFGVAVETNQPREAHEYARAAFQEYGPHHPQLPRLAHDVAYFWTTLGYFERALSVFKSLMDHVDDPALRLALMGDMGRAAGGVGDRETFQMAWDEVGEITRQTPGLDTEARAFLDLAYGALSLGAWDRAIDAGQRALELARAKGEAKTTFQAEAVLDAGRRHQRAELHRAAEHEEWSAEADSLATEFVHSLTS
ncbi:MAG TPA: tetratricopeptide repeat protein [Longimicrobiaceae bacterium]